MSYYVVMSHVLPIPLNRNESYWLLDDTLMASVAAALGSREFSTYPSYALLRETLATYAQVDPDLVCVTAGSEGIISAIIEMCVREHRIIALPVPTFYGYETYLRRHRAEVIPTFYEERDGAFIFPTEATLKLIQEGSVGALFLCNPNNPLGDSIPKTDLDLLLDAARDHGVLAVVDEAYFEFSDSSVLSRIDQQPILIIRTLSKSFGIAGARVGYCIGSRDIIPALNELAPIWGIAHSSAALACILLSQESAIRARRSELIAQRTRFCNELSHIPGVHVYPTRTNFVLVQVKDAAHVTQELAKQGILIGECVKMSSYKQAQDLLKDKIRMTVPSPKDQQQVIECLRKALTE